MNIRVLQLLQQAAPVLLRHLDAYLELAEQDMAATKTDAVARLQLIAVFCISALFMLFMGCVLVIAITWDGPNRVLAIVFMGGIFTALAVASGLYLVNRRATKPFMGVRREWQQDRELVSRLLNSNTEKAVTE
jgi:uncharacterized membrane protein YqjE